MENKKEFLMIVHLFRLLQILLFNRFIKSFIAINLQKQHPMKIQAISQNQDPFRLHHYHTPGRMLQDPSISIKWEQNMRRFELYQAGLNDPNPCKIQENPTYKIHVGSQPQAKVKIEQGTRVEEAESTEMLMQRRAIFFSGKAQLSSQEKEQLQRSQYLIKKKRRNYDKKVLYTTRKVVADRRIRYKGKFINVFQAREMLGLADEGYSFEELKEMMKSMLRNKK